MWSKAHTTRTVRSFREIREAAQHRVSELLCSSGDFALGSGAAVGLRRDPHFWPEVYVEISV